MLPLILDVGGRLNRSITKSDTFWALAIATFLAIIFLSASASYASAETYTTTTQADSGYSTAIEQARKRCEDADKGYREARTAYVDEGTRAYALQLHADMLDNLIPVQQERSDEAARQLYKNQERPYSMFDMLLDSKSLDDFLAQAEYLNRVTKANVDEINRTHTLVNEVSKERASIETARSDSQAQLDAAKAEVEAATEELDSVYREREERAKQGIERAQKEHKASSGSSDDEGDGNEAVAGDLAALDDGADWHMTEDEFVAEWAPRLDAYLAGSALAGEGEHFAKSAWKYCIDPRWSAAISNIESSKGAVCIRPHNAWGWGAADSDPYNLASEWKSWEEAIDAHSRGLAKGYGYTLTLSGARTYCPPNWKHWYEVTLGEMAKI